MDALIKFIDALQKVISKSRFYHPNLPLNNNGHFTDATFSKYVWRDEEKFHDSAITEIVKPY